MGNYYYDHVAIVTKNLHVFLFYHQTFKRLKCVQILQIWHVRKLRSLTINNLFLTSSIYAIMRDKLKTQGAKIKNISNSWKVKSAVSSLLSISFYVELTVDFCTLFMHNELGISPV